MVSSLSRANILNTTATQVKAQKDDVAKLVKYVKGEALTQAPDTFSGNVKKFSRQCSIF